MLQHIALQIGLLVCVREEVRWSSGVRCSVFEEELLANAHGVFRSLHRMADGPASSQRLSKAYRAQQPVCCDPLTVRLVCR